MLAKPTDIFFRPRLVEVPPLDVTEFGARRALIVAGVAFKGATLTPTGGMPPSDQVTPGPARAMVAAVPSYAMRGPPPQGVTVTGPAVRLVSCQVEAWAGSAVAPTARAPRAAGRL